MCSEGKTQHLHFICDIKKPYLHNTFIFLNMLHSSPRKPLHHRTAACSLGSVFKILNQVEILLISQPITEGDSEGGGSEGRVMVSTPPREGTGDWRLRTHSRPCDLRGQGRSTPSCRAPGAALRVQHQELRRAGTLDLAGHLLARGLL